jgi:hypothetical protein
LPACFATERHSLPLNGFIIPYPKLKINPKYKIMFTAFDSSAAIFRIFHGSFSDRHNILCLPENAPDVGKKLFIESLHFVYLSPNGTRIFEQTSKPPARRNSPARSAASGPLLTGRRAGFCRAAR